MTTSPTPTWLPDIINVNGEWSQVIQILYRIFETDIKQTQRFIDNLPVWWDRNIQTGEIYEEGFWHLITKEDYAAKVRLPDFRRAERLPWCGPAISNASDPIIKIWNYKEDAKRVRIYIWLEQFDYVIVLERRKQRFGEIAFLITAFHIDGESKRRNLQQKYKNREP